MEESSSPVSVSMPVAPKKSSGKPRESRSRQSSWAPRPVYIAITFALILTIGWGAFSIMGRPSQSDEDAELADLEGFEEESPSLEAPEPQTKLSSGSSSPRDFSSRTFGERAKPWQTAPAPGSTKFPALFAIPDNPSARFERTPDGANMNDQTTSGAWLIGTIEADEAPERIALPPRVSQAVADGPLFR